MKTIKLDGVEYELKRIHTPEKPETGLSVDPVKSSASIIDGYLKKKTIKVAQPKISDYRERFKQRKVKANELRTNPRMMGVLPKQDKNLDQFQYGGEKLFFGPGIEEEV